MFLYSYWASLVAQMVKNLSAVQGDLSSILGLGRSPGEGNDYPRQYSWLENPMDRGAWRAITPGVAKNTFTFNNAVTRNFIFYIFRIFSQNSRYCILSMNIILCMNS